MSEISKLYENVGIAKTGSRKCTTCEYLDCQNYCFISENNKCDKFSYQYPPFTAEKQIELIKWLAKRPLTIYNVDDEFIEFSTGYEISDFGSFEESLAEIINTLWQSLTIEEKQRIKEILE